MRNLWNDAEAAQFTGALPQRVYTSRLLGREKSLVLHGGGNTSVKTHEFDLFGREQEILYVKGSGWDLETIEAEEFSPVRLDAARELAALPALSDAEMVNALRCAMIRADAPTPSVETILHALLPYRYVDHTHADAIISLTNTPDGEAHVYAAFGESVIILPYIMPGFKLARQVYEHLPAFSDERVRGMILLKHGIFTFGDTARESYDRMIDLVSIAEHYLEANGAWTMPALPVARQTPPSRAEIAALRRSISETAGAPMIVTIHDDDTALGFAQHANLAALAQQGPATPDHVIRTKRLPLIGRDVAAYAESYRAYFEVHRSRADHPLTMLDPAPRVLLDPQFGLCTAGRSVKDARIAEDIYRHTIEIILRAALLGGYQALPAEDIFDVEYWELEQAKLRVSRTPPPFTGEIALVTGAASGIGKACAESLLARGAAVIGIDINPAIETLFDRAEYLGIRADLTDETSITAALDTCTQRFGGLDMLVLNAGIFPASKKIEALALDEWSRVMRINLDANLVLMRETFPLLKQAPRGGRVVIIGSKNVPAPGPGAAAYSASKAALNQLGRVAALEWGGARIRVNIVHPNAVFDTGIWTEEVLAARAKHYGLTVEAYKTNNVLKVEVTSRHVAEVVAELCGETFSRTTGAQIPIDGGNDRVI